MRTKQELQRRAETRFLVVLYILGIGMAVLGCLGCQGPDPVRLKSERANYYLAKRCADGWFQALPFTVQDEQLVRGALEDWDRALRADETLATGPIGQ